MNSCFPVVSGTRGSESNFCLLFSSFFEVSLPQTTKEPVSEVSKMMGIRAYFTLSNMLAWDPE